MQLKSLHLTNGGPWHGVHTALSQKWLQELVAMLGERNPCAEAQFEDYGSGQTLVEVEFFKPKQRG